ncbi:MAG: TetR/AcrR family transcriptional regulator [Blastocatellia bacterium]|nr:TetR/AcrR family transcriptional regulator [Blastocatellia bacterium]
MARGEDTKAEILKEAMAQASKYGLEGISIGGLAKSLGLSKSGLFAHFNSLENLQLEVLQATVNRFVEVVVIAALKQPRGEPRVRALFKNLLDWTNSKWMPGGCLLMSAADEFDDRPGPVRDFLVKNHQDLMSTILTAAKIAVDEGHFRADLDLEQFAFDAFAIFLSYHHYKRLLNDPNAEAHFNNSVDRLIKNCCQ